MMVELEPRIFEALHPGWRFAGHAGPALVTAEHPAIGRATGADMGELTDWVDRLTARYEMVRAEANYRDEQQRHHDGLRLVAPIDLPSGARQGAQDSGRAPDPYLIEPGRGLCSTIRATKTSATDPPRAVRG